jgi:hypothetical protein
MLSKLKDSQEIVQDSIGKYHYSAIITVKNGFNFDKYGYEADQFY